MPKPSVTGFKYVPDKNGDEGLVMAFPEAAGQTFVAGDLIKFASNAISLATTNGATSETILGIAEEPASGVTSRLTKVRCFRPGDIFLCNLSSGQTFATANTGVAYSIKQASAGIWTVDTANTTQVRCVVLGSADLTNLDASITPFSGVGGRVVLTSPQTAGGPVFVKIGTSSTHIFLAA